MKTTDSTRQPTPETPLFGVVQEFMCTLSWTAGCCFLHAVILVLKTIRPAGLAVGLACVSAVLPAVNVVAQDAPLPPPDENDSIEDVSSQLRTDRRTIQHVELLATAVQRGNLKAVREQLELLQQAEPTLLVPRSVAASAAATANSDPNWVPLYRAVFDVVHQLSEADRAELSRTEQDRADFEFKSILNGQRWSLLMKLLLRFPTTDAAYRTHLLWAHLHLDRGNQLAARLWLAPLTEPGIPDPWRTTAERITKRAQEKRVAAAQRHRQTASHQQNPSAATSVQHSHSDAAHVSFSHLPQNTRTGNHQTLTVSFAGSNTPSTAVVDQNQSAEDPATLNHLADASMPDQFPLQIGWIHQPNMPPTLRAACNKLADFAAQINVIAWSNWHPVIDEKAIFIRTLRGVTALDRKTGTTLWSWVARTSLDETITGFTSSSSISRLLDARDAISGYASLDRSPVADLFFRNGIAGRLACDDKQVYLISIPANQTRQNQVSRALIQRGSVPRLPSSELSAIDKDSGQRRWTVGGGLIEETFGNELTQAWFAGVPATDGRNLYVVMEQQESIYLVCLSAGSGQFRWKVPMAFPGMLAASDPSRLTTPVIPVIHSGVILSPTGTGWTMAIDSLTQNILWATRTDRALTNTEIALQRNRRFSVVSQKSLRESWAARQPILCNDLLIQNDGHNRQALVLDVLTGALRHRHYNSEFSSLLHADEKRLVFWGPNGIQALTPETGKVQWKSRMNVSQNPNEKPQSSSENQSGRPRPAENPLLPTPNQDRVPGLLPSLLLDRLGLGKSGLQINSESQKTRLIPAGTAAAKGDWLYIPLIDRSILPVNMRDGQLQPILKRTDAYQAWGDLIRADDEIYVYQPGQLLLLTDSPGTSTTQDTLQQASNLLQSGQPQAALARLAESEQLIFERSKTRRLQFEILTQLIADTLVSGSLPKETSSKTAPHDIPALPPTNLPALSDQVQEQLNQWLSVAEQLSSNESEQALLLQLKVRQAIAGHTTQEALSLIESAFAKSDLQLTQSVTADLTELPRRLDDRPTSFSAADQSHKLTRKRLLAAWLIDQVLGIRHSGSAETTAHADRLLNGLPDRYLIQVNHPIVCDELLRRADRAITMDKMAEIHAHMLLQVVNIIRSVNAVTSDSGKPVTSDATANAPVSAITQSFAAVTDPQQVLQQFLKWHAINRQQQVLPQPAETPGANVDQPQRSGSHSHTRRTGQLLAAIIADLQQLSLQTSDSATAAFTSTMLSDADRQQLLQINKQHKLEQQWLSRHVVEWPDQPYVAMPVTNNVFGQQNQQPINEIRPDDVFLRNFTWLAKVSPSVVVALPLDSKTQDAWAFAGAFGAASPYIQTAGTIDRQGSILIISNDQRMQAYSVIDQTNLWDRTLDKSRSRSLQSSDENSRLFEDITIYSRSSLVPGAPRELLNCGSSPRWICLQTPDRLDVIDSLTGESLWSLQGHLSDYYTIATADAVLMLNSRSRQLHCYRADDGTPLPDLSITPDDVVSAIKPVDRDLVTLRPRRLSANPRLLEWINPVTGSVTRQIQLHDVTSFQLTDPCTLFATGTQKAHLIDLTTGSQQTFDIPTLPTPRTADTATETNLQQPTPDDATPPPADHNEPAGPADNSPPGNSHSPGTSRRLFAHTDPANIYLIDLRQQPRVNALQMMGVRVPALNSWIQAIDRETGQLRWQIDATQMTTASYEARSVPVMVLAQLENTNAGNPAAFLGRATGWRLHCRGILKSTGKTIFEQSLSYRMPISNLHIAITPEGMIDFDAFGNKIRFIAQSQTSLPPNSLPTSSSNLSDVIPENSPPAPVN